MFGWKGFQVEVLVFSLDGPRFGLRLGLCSSSRSFINQIRKQA